MRARRTAAGLVGIAAALLSPRLAAAEPAAWVVDDGEKIPQGARDTAFEHGEDNPVWSPGEPVRLFAMRNESVAVQVVVAADDADLEGLTVELPELRDADGAALVDTAKSQVVGRPIERFVEHFVDVWHASRGKLDGGSRGWEPGSGPPDRAWVGRIPDALIPVEDAPAWDPYPMKVRAHASGVVWIDVNVPRDQAPGAYQGVISVATAERTVGTFPVELEVVDAMLPDRTVRTAVYYDHEMLAARSGNGAERHLWQLLRAHRVTPVHDATSASDVDRQEMAFTGQIYTKGYGYAGPGPAQGDDLLMLGAFGALGGPDEGTLGRVRSIVAEAARSKILGSTEVVLHAADERCSSPSGMGWRKLLRETEDPDLLRVRVGWTCSQDPTAQPVDVPMVEAAFDARQVSEARAQGKETWVYGGVLPRTGTFLLDADAVSPRVNGWLSAIDDVPRWLVRDATRWYTSSPEEPLDPFDSVETIDGEDGEWANGEGVLVYPGKQTDGFSVGIDGVLPSIRLKNWRRGIEDAGYLQMARKRDAAAADAVARWLVPAAFGEAKSGQPASWGVHGKRFFEARRALLAIAMGTERVALDRPAAETSPVAASAPARGTTTQAAGGLALGLVGLVGIGRLRRRKS
jgi:hypothetical protein